jgi:hypothetical protein
VLGIIAEGQLEDWTRNIQLDKVLFFLLNENFGLPIQLDFQLI